MAILIQQDYAQAGDSLGMRAKVRPQDIKSGTYYGQLQLRGSILVIKDAQDTASGFMSFGTDMTTIPTSSTTGTGIYIDYSGIYGLASGTAKFTLDAATGTITATGATISGTITATAGNIGGWTVTSTALSNAGGTVTLRGAGNLAFGATPPTAANTGTGVFIDHTGIYGLNANTQQFYLQATDGKAYAGGGEIVIDSTAFKIAGNTNRINFYTNTGFSTLIASLSGNITNPGITISANGGVGDVPQVLLTNSLSGSANQAQLGVITDATSGYIYATSNGTFSGMNIGGNTRPSSTLEIQASAPSLRLYDITGSAKSLLVTVDANLATFEEAGGTDILVMDLTNAAVYLSDTSNANMTIGLTINQGANDNQIFALKSSDVAHGVTTLAETDTFGYITKFSGTDGGVSFVGLNDTAAVGVRIAGVATTANTTHTTGGLGAVIIDGFLKSGTGVASLGADANILAVRDNGTTRFMLDADGDSHQDVGTAWTNFDEHDDLALLNLMSAHVTRQDDPLREHFSAWLEQSRDDLERLKLVTFNADGHHFINWSRMQMLQVGALRQIGERLERLEREHHH